MRPAPNSHSWASWLARRHPLAWRLRPARLVVGMLLGLGGIVVALLEPLSLHSLGAGRTPTAWGLLVLTGSALLYFDFVIRPRRLPPLGAVGPRVLAVSFAWTYAGMALLVGPLCLYDGLWSARVATLYPAAESQVVAGALRAAIAVPCSPQWSREVESLMRPLSPAFVLNEGEGPLQRSRRVPIHKCANPLGTHATGLERVLQEQAFGAGPAPHVLNAAARSWGWRQSGCLVFALLGLLLDVFSDPRRRAVFAPALQVLHSAIAEWNAPGGVPGSRDWAALGARWPVLWASQWPQWCFVGVLLGMVTRGFGRELLINQRQGVVLVLGTVLVIFGLWFASLLASRHSLALGTTSQWLGGGIAIGACWWSAAAATGLFLGLNMGPGWGAADDLQDRFLAAIDWRTMGLLSTSLAGWVAVFAWLAHCGLAPFRAWLSLSLVLLPWGVLVPSNPDAAELFPQQILVLVGLMALGHGLCLSWFRRRAAPGAARAWVGLAVMGGTAVLATGLAFQLVALEPLALALAAVVAVWLAALVAMLPAVELLRRQHLAPR